MYHSCLFTYSFLVTQLQAVFHFFRVIIGSGSHAFPLVKSGLLHTKKQCSFLSQTSNRNITFESQERKTLHQLNRVWFCYVLLKESCIL